MPKRSDVKQRRLRILKMLTKMHRPTTFDIMEELDIFPGTLKHDIVFLRAEGFEIQSQQVEAGHVYFFTDTWRRAVRQTMNYLEGKDSALLELPKAKPKRKRGRPPKWPVQ